MIFIYNLTKLQFLKSVRQKRIGKTVTKKARNSNVHGLFV